MVTGPLESAGSCVMKPLSTAMSAITLLIPVLAGLPARGVAATPTQIAPTFANLQGEVVLDNQRVMVQRFVLEPGQSTGLHSHPSDQLLVFIKGGVLRSQAGRSTLWRDGRVLWQNVTERTDEGSTNAGAAPIVMICVSLKPVASSASATSTGQPKYRYLNYPNIPGEDL